jgi:threonine/homoserine/homoserine lactone efflux protein
MYFLFLTQIIGVIFYGVFYAAYVFALPSLSILTGEPVYHSLLSIFGGLFLIFVSLGVVLSAVTKPKNVE